MTLTFVDLFVFYGVDMTFLWVSPYIWYPSSMLYTWALSFPFLVITLGYINCKLTKLIVYSYVVVPWTDCRVSLLWLVMK